MASYVPLSYELVRLKVKKNSRVGRLSGIAQLLLLPTLAYICLGVSLVAQTFNSGTTENLGESWTAVTEVKTPTSNPTRLIESHTQDGNRTLDKKLFQVTGFDRHFEFYKKSKLKPYKWVRTPCERRRVCMVQILASRKRWCR